MPTWKLVDLVEGVYNNMNIFPIIILREAMEGEHHRDRQVAGPLLDRTYPHSQMNPHNPTIHMSLMISLINISRSTTHCTSLEIDHPRSVLWIKIQKQAQVIPQEKL